MAIDLLDAPLRVSWDIDAAKGSLAGDQLGQVARQLLDAGVFFVSLEGAPLAHPAIIPLLRQLASGCQVALVMRGSAAELALLDEIPPAVKLYVDCAQDVQGDEFSAERLTPVLARLRAVGRSPSLLWIPRRGELPAVLSILEFCAVESIRDFKLPNQKIDASCGPDHLPDTNDLEQLAAAVKQRGLPPIADFQFAVHDLFLWELLQPLSGGQRSEYGGCQAGNSLGHVAADGQLWPCSSWPEALGSLLENDLADLWQSQQRFDIRQQIATVPSGCEGCRDYHCCFGGCRGLSSFCRNDQLNRDLLCAGLR